MKVYNELYDTKYTHCSDLKLAAEIRIANSHTHTPQSHTHYPTCLTCAYQGHNWVSMADLIWNSSDTVAKTKSSAIVIRSDETM